MYAEMLTGVHPFGGVGFRKTAPNLDRLPEVDRDVIRRSLDVDPSKRFANCTDMLLALEGGGRESNKKNLEPSDAFANLIASERNTKRKAIYTGSDPVNVTEVIANLIQEAGGEVEPLAPTSPKLCGAGEAARCQFVAGLPLGSAQERLQVFCREMFAQIVSVSEAHCAMRFELPSTFWQNWWGQQPTLELHIDLTRVNPMSATPIEVKAELQAKHCAKSKAITLFQKMGQEIFDGLQHHLLVNAEKRGKDRLFWPHPITITPIDKHGEPGEPIDCRGKDLSQAGMGFYLPHELDTAEVLIDLPDPTSSSTVKVPATLVRAKRCADGWYEVGALFRLPAKCKSWAEVCV
jgi:hypothetical protein